MLIKSMPDSLTNEPFTEAQVRGLDALMTEAKLTSRQRLVVDQHLRSVTRREIAGAMGLPERVILKTLAVSYSKLRAMAASKLLSQS